MAVSWVLVLICLRLVSAACNPSPEPSCEVLAPTREPCWRFHTTDYCCYGRHLLGTVRNVTTAYAEAGAFPSSNVSFYSNARDKIGFFLLGRAGSSPVHSECYLLETGTEGELQVSVENLPTTGKYKVEYGDDLRSYHTWLKQACVGDKESFFASSVLDLLFNKADARVQLYRPKNVTLIPPELSSLRVTLHSSATNFTCGKEGNCTTGAAVQNSFCVDKPYDSVVEIRNASQFSNGTHGLRYHCAVVELPGCCIRTRVYTIKEALPVARPERPEVVTQSAIAIRVGLGLLAALGVVLIACARYLYVLYCRRDVHTSSDPLPLEQELRQLLRPLRPVLLLYCWENNDHLKRVVEILEKVMHESLVEVTNPYKKPDALLENVQRAAEDVFHDNDWFVIETRRSKEIRRNARKCLQLDNTFDQFYATVFELTRTYPILIEGKQILTLTLTQDTSDIPLRSRRICSPNFAEDLLKDIPGVNRSDSWEALFNELRSHVRQYNEDEPDVT